jgi:hypothetical protein
MLETQKLVQAEKQVSAAEIMQLQGIGSALRDELEKQKLETQKLVQSERQAAAAEIQQLKDATEALRHKLESK